MHWRWQWSISQYFEAMQVAVEHSQAIEVQKVQAQKHSKVVAVVEVL